MPWRRTSSNFCTLYQNDILPFGEFDRQIVGTVMINLDIFMVGIIFHVFGERNRIQPFLPRLLNPNIGPDVAIGKDRVHVEVAF